MTGKQDCRIAEYQNIEPMLEERHTDARVGQTVNLRSYLVIYFLCKLAKPYREFVTVKFCLFHCLLAWRLEYGIIK